ncbi:unnamed protein product, partial [Prorocentrum cordatum]
SATRGGRGRDGAGHLGAASSADAQRTARPQPIPREEATPPPLARAAAARLPGALAGRWAATARVGILCCELGGRARTHAERKEEEEEEAEEEDEEEGEGWRRTITRSNNNSSKRMQKRVYVLMEIRPLQTLMNPFREELDLFGGGGGRRRMDEEEEEEDEEQQQQQQQAYAKKGLRPDGDQATVDIDEFIPLL